jgi:hypothetical protein
VRAGVPNYFINRAVDLLRKQIEEMDGLKGLRDDAPEVRKWKATSEAVLRAAFGKPRW